MGILDRFRGKKKEEKIRTKSQEEILQEKLKGESSLYRACFDALKEMSVKPVSENPESSFYVIDKDTNIVDENIEKDILFYDAEALQYDIWEFLPADPSKTERIDIPIGQGTEKLMLTLDNAKKLQKEYKDNLYLKKNLLRGTIGLLLSKGYDITDSESKEKILNDMMGYGEEFLKATEGKRRGLLVAYFPVLALNAVKKYIDSQPVEEQKPSK